MTRLIQLTVEHLRNLGTISLQPDTSINVVVGANGSGKTSLLEAIFILGRAKSFRDAHILNAVTLGQNTCRLFGLVGGKRGDSLSTSRIGLELSRQGGRIIRVDGDPVKRSSDLADVLPLTYVGLEETRLLSESPAPRRRFLDWGLFHVEHRYRSAWQRYERALKQRNAVLKQKRSVVRPSDVAFWDAELAPAAIELVTMREAYVSDLAPVFRSYWHILTDQSATQMELGYEAGCPAQVDDFKSILTSSLARDGDRGYTQHGPHRADVMVYRDGQPLGTFASAGEQKAAVCALHLAQWELFRRGTGNSPILLIDDLPAELDMRRRRLFFELVSSLECQAFITATESDLLDARKGDEVEKLGKMFHVEHGKLEL